MKLKPFLKADRIVLGLKDGSRSSVLGQLIEPLIAADIVSDGDAFLADLERREAEITTVMDNGVAIPHARSHAVRSLGLVVGLAGEEGIHFHPDGEVCSHLFFCIAVPSFAPTAHIPMLQSLAHFARDPNRVSKILASGTAAAAARYLGSYKG